MILEFDLMEIDKYLYTWKEYLMVMSATGDTASNLGNAMDELMRHQPSLRSDATKAIIKVTAQLISCVKQA